MRISATFSAFALRAFRAEAVKQPPWQALCPVPLTVERRGKMLRRSYKLDLPEFRWELRRPVLAAAIQALSYVRTPLLGRGRVHNFGIEFSFEETAASGPAWTAAAAEEAVQQMAAHWTSERTAFSEPCSGWSLKSPGGEVRWLITGKLVDCEVISPNPAFIGLRMHFLRQLLLPGDAAQGED